MRVAILDKNVRKNIERFKHLIQREAMKRERFYQVSRKTYHAYIHRHTGAMRFSKLEEGAYPKDEWKEVDIKLKPECEEGPFEISSCDQSDVFECDLDPKAYMLLTKTIHILNQLCKDKKNGSNPFWVLRHVAKLDFEMTEEEEGKRNLVHEAWHNVDRYDAELLLSGHPIGTYLFRKGEFAKELEHILNTSFPVPIICITLTMVDWEDKISEKTLIYKDGEWLFYNDDPELLGKSYPTVKELLATLGERLSQPLLA